MAPGCRQAGLYDALTAPGPFTLFAPNDAAFEAALVSLKIKKMVREATSPQPTSDSAARRLRPAVLPARRRSARINWWT
jgi:hypothetical protein